MEEVVSDPAPPVVVETGDWRIEVHLRESAEGSGAWSVVEVGIRPADPGRTITASALTRLPFHRVLRTAVNDALGARSSVPVFAFPSDPPTAFCESRQGRAPRTERDWAHLAAAWLDAQRFYDARPGGELRLDVERTYEQIQDVPKRWHARYPDISVKTWQTNISSMKRRGLVEEGPRGWDLTEHARLLLGWPDPDTINGEE